MGLLPAAWGHEQSYVLLPWQTCSQESKFWVLWVASECGCPCGQLSWARRWGKANRLCVALWGRNLEPWVRVLGVGAEEGAMTLGLGVSRGKIRHKQEAPGAGECLTRKEQKCTLCAWMLTGRASDPAWNRR